MKRRLLPDGCYDFLVVDCREGEERGPFDTHAEAVLELRRWRRRLDRMSGWSLYVEHRINERKIVRLAQSGRLMPTVRKLLRESRSSTRNPGSK